MKIDLSNSADTITFKTHLVEILNDVSLPAVQGPVDAHLSIIKSGKDVAIDGTLTITLSFECSRCLKTFSNKIEIPFDAYFEIDLLQEKQEINISEDVRQTIILAIPAKPLCREDCPGLCSQCGKNLSEGTCACKKAQPDNRMANLKIFKFKK